MTDSPLIFGKYEIVRRVAVGGMGEIFLASQTGDVAGFERPVILKSLLPDLAEQPRFVEQFLDEARVAATLNHPNIVSLYEVGCWEGTYYIAMEYIQGDNLNALLRMVLEQKVSFPVSYRAYLIREAALGLDHAHHASDAKGRPNNIVHRDISPSNIMVRTDGAVKVVDFGIAKAQNRAAQTATGLIKGKVRYMSPEQLRGEPLDHRSDQFSLGIVMWELLANRRLFRRTDGELQVLKAHATGKIAPPSTHNKEVPPELDALALRMMCADRSGRLPRCGEVADVLAPFARPLDSHQGQQELAALLEKLFGERSKSLARGSSKSENFIIPLARGTSDSSPEILEPRPRAHSISDELEPPEPPPSEEKEPSLELDVVTATSEAAFTETVATPAADPTRTRISAGQLAAGGIAFAIVVAAGLLLAPSEVKRVELESAPPPAHVPPPAPAPPVIERAPDPPPSPPVEEPRVKAARTKPKKGRTPIAATPPAVVAPPAASAPPAEAKGDGWLTLRTKPWTQVFIDGDPHGTSPLFRVRLTPGKHALRLVNEGEKIDVKRELEIAPGDTTKLDLTF